MFKVKKLLVATLVSSVFLFSPKVFAAPADLSAETSEYKAFIEQQIDMLVKDTQTFVMYLQQGKLDEAKALYPKVRMYYERSEPIAETFGDLDPRIDAREADLEEGQVWTGFHKIEKILWTENTTTGTVPIGEQLLADVKELRAKIPTVEITGDVMVNGAIDLLNEVTTSKITGEEEIFSRTDLYDFKANVEGAEKIFEILKVQVAKKDPKLVQELNDRFVAVNTLLDKYKVGDDYQPYTSLNDVDLRALSDAVNKLGEPLSQLGVILDETK